MKVRDFNFKNQSHNRQTKVVVISKNDFIKVGTVLTVGDADTFMIDAMNDLVPYELGSTDKQNKKRWDYIDKYRKKIIQSLELKN